MTVGREIGPIGDLPAEQVVAAARTRPPGPDHLARGRALPRHAALPGASAVPGPQLPDPSRDPGHRCAEPWGPVNDAGLGYMAEYVMATSHSGAHMDALAHMTVGDGHALVRWRQRRRAPDRLRPDPRRRFAGCLRSSPAACSSTRRATGAWTACRRARRSTPPSSRRSARPRASRSSRWDVVVIRTGYMGLWPDAERMAAHKTAGTRHLGRSLAARARRRGDRYGHRDVRGPARPDPVPPATRSRSTPLLLIENGVYLMESLDLEELARERTSTSSCFVALPVKIRGATGSMVDPVAVV